THSPPPGFLLPLALLRRFQRKDDLELLFYLITSCSFSSKWPLITAITLQQPLSLLGPAFLTITYRFHSPLRAWSAVHTDPNTLDVRPNKITNANNTNPDWLSRTPSHSTIL